MPILLVTLEDIPKRLQGFRGEEIDATVDDVTDKSAGFLHIVQDLMRLWVLNDAAVVEGLRPVGRGAKEQERVALASVGIQHGVQGEVGADISIEYEERLRASSQDLVPEMVETTSCAQGANSCRYLIGRWNSCWAASRNWVRASSGW